MNAGYLLAIGLSLATCIANIVRAVTVQAVVDPPTATRAQNVQVRVSVKDRIQSDRVPHYMIWMAEGSVPNALRVEGGNVILAEDKRGEIPLDVSWWPDGTYNLRIRAYYHANAQAPVERLDTQAELVIKGGPPDPEFRIVPNAEALAAGEPLQLNLTYKEGTRIGRVMESSLISRGQQIRDDQEIPLTQTEQPIASWNGGASGSIETSGWRAQRLNSLQVRTKIKNPASGQLAVLTLPVPDIAIRPQGQSVSPRIMPSYRGSGMIHLLTNEPALNTFTYPTCTSWRNNGKDVFIETDRPRPDGTQVPDERQLVMVDTQTGTARHLATLAVEDVSQYGERHTKGSSSYHFDYAPRADLLVYYNMTGHRMYTLRPGGKPIEILHETEGRIGDPPAISPDGKHVLYYVVFNGPLANRYFFGRTSGVFILDLDPATGKAVGEPKLIHAYPWVNSHDAKAAASPRDFVARFIAVNHVQFNPTDSTRIMYAHEGTYPRNGAPENSRIWHMRSDGSDRHAMAPQQEIGTYYTHEVYGPLGQYIYTVWGKSVARIHVETNRFECIYQDQKPLGAAHIGISPDEKWIVADMLSGFGQDNDGNGIGGLFLIETATGKTTFLAAFPAGHAHPRHVHPNFSPDGTKIGFTIAQGKRHSQAAYIDVSDIVRNVP